MKVLLGADHRGVEFKQRIIEKLQDWKYELEDLGTNNPDESCDYPRIAYKVATVVAADPESRGILVCMSGIGQAMAANKVRGAYAALCYNAEAAELSRQHNNANILVLSSKFVPEDEVSDILRAWLTAEFEGGRHQRRVDQIKQIEAGQEPQ